jgi:4-amino-4-deoxy-L-arabinose transferase-like glycosyltransferase
MKFTNINQLSSNPFLSQHSLSQRMWWTSLVGIMLLAALIAFSGISIPPIEAHEAFVLLAAQGMYDHKDWIVPWFNGEPHLTKPPLSYWLTAFFAWLNGSLDNIQPWHARVPSAFAGVGLVFLTAISGKKLFEPAVGLMGAVVAASSVGFFNYTHSARPEMLYAFLCSAALAIFIHIRLMPIGHIKAKLGANLIWVVFGLATLTKGPQLPVMILLVFLFDCRRRSLTLKQSMTMLQPLSGGVILMAVTLPWWWLLHHRLGGAGIAGTQLSGSLLTIHLLKALDPYYLYRPLQLLLPWLIFLPAIAYLPWRRKLPEQLWLLIMTILLPALILSFGPQKRWYYMLPALMPMALLLAAGMMELFRRNASKPWARYIHLAVLVPALAFVVMGNTSKVWSESRFSQQELALVASKQVQAGYPLVAWGVTPAIYVYYTKHPVEHVHSLSELLDVIKKSQHQTIALLLDTKDIGSLPADLKFQVLKQSESKEDDPVSLLKIN